MAHRRRLRQGLRWALALCLLAGVAACTRRSTAQDESPEVRVAASFAPSPPAVGEGQLTLTFFDAAGQPVGVERLQLKADMAHPGMTPWLAEFASLHDTQVTLPVTWSMAGDWILQVDAELRDGRRLLREVPLQVVLSDETGAD
jgi:hypothetical protein